MIVIKILNESMKIVTGIKEDVFPVT